MDTCVDPNVPPWKLELINRRRIRNNQTKCGGGGSTAEQQLQVKPVQWTWSPTTQHFLQQPNAVRRTLTTPPPPQQQQQQRQQQRQQCHQQPPPQQQQQHPSPPSPSMPAVVAVGTVCTGMRLFKCEATIMTNFKKNPQINRCRSKFKTKPQIITEITNGLDYRSDSSEEFKYGPGIVNKLKSKYMSMTVREQRPRPPLRRSTSMDNIVEDKRPEKAPAAVVKLCSQPDVISVAATVKSETMKRARSMELLSEPHTTATIVNGNGYGDNDDDNGVNDEQHQHQQQQQQQQPKQTNGELPPPDVVKTYKKIFETKTQNDVKPPIKIKPAILPKPMLSPEKTRPARTNKVPSKKMPPPIKYPNRYDIFANCLCKLLVYNFFSTHPNNMISTTV